MVVRDCEHYLSNVSHFYYMADLGTGYKIDRHDSCSMSYYSIEEVEIFWYILTIILNIMVYKCECAKLAPSPHWDIIVPLELPVAPQCGPELLIPADEVPVIGGWLSDDRVPVPEPHGILCLIGDVQGSRVHVVAPVDDRVIHNLPDFILLSGRDVLAKGRGPSTAELINSMTQPQFIQHVSEIVLAVVHHPDILVLD